MAADIGLTATAVLLTSAYGSVSRVSPVQTALRNCTRDEGGPFGFGDQELMPSYRKLLWSKAVGVKGASGYGIASGALKLI